MAVLLNGVAQLEYDRSKTLPDHQLAYLQQMDRRMDAGIELAGETINSPETLDRVKFVTANLLQAIKADDEASVAAFCSYIAQRMPEIKQVRMNDFKGETSIELVFDQDYRRQVSIPVTTLNG